MRKSTTLSFFATLAAMGLFVLHAQAQALAPESGRSKNILTLYSGQFGLPGYDSANAGLWPVLRAAGIATDTVFSEYLDLVRNPSPAYRDRMADFLKQKYAGRNISAIIAISTGAASLVLDERYRLFEGVPVIAALPLLSSLPNTAIHPLVFLGARYDIAGTLQDALDVLPETRNVLVVTGVGEFDRNQEHSAREQLKPWDGKLPIVYLSDLPAEEILRRVSTPPPHTVILYLGLFQDVTGRSFITDDFARALGRSATAPIFSIQDGWLDAGIVGGSMTSFQEDGAAAGRLAIEILNGESVTHVPPTVVPVPNRSIFQWAQLQRWGLDESKLPAHSLVVGKPARIWQQHPVATLAMLAFVILQSGLIVALLWQRRQKRTATEKLSESEEKFRKFFTNVPDYCYIVDKDGTIRDANRSAQAFLGYTRKELIGRPWRSIYAARRRPQVDQLFEQWRQTGELRNEETAIISKDGLERTVLLSAATVRDGDGTILFSTAVQTDITERKHAEEALRQNAALLKNAEEIGQFGSSSWDVINDVTIWSEGLYRIVGRDAGQPTPGYAERAALYTPESWARFDGAIKRALAIGEPFDLEVELLRPDGARRWARALGAPIHDDEGRVVRLHGTLQDITARKRAADALRESEERFRTAFESAAIGMGLVGHDGRWLRVNRSLCQIVGYTPDELLATDFQSITYPEDLAANMDLLRQMLDGSLPGYQMEKRYVHKQGRLVWVSLSVALVRSPRGEPIYAIAQVQDITERKEAERKLLREKAFTDAVIDNVPGLFYLLDAQGKAVRWNRRAEQTTGYSIEEGSHMQPVEFFPGADRAALAEALRKVFVDGYAELEANLVIKSGAAVPFYFSAARVSFEGEQFLIGNGMDISALKDAEKALRDSEEKFSKAFRNSPVMLSISTFKEGRYLDVNSTFERITGWRREEVVGRSRDDIGIVTLEARREANARILSSGGYRNLESEFRTRSGELRIARTSAETIEFAGQTCLLTVSEDITDQRGFERELRALNETLERRVRDRTAELEQAVESLRMLSQAIENGPASVMISDPEGTIEYVNPKFCETTGYAREEAIGRKANLLKSGAHAPEFFKNLWTTIQDGETWRGEFCNKKRNGGLYWESACISTVRDTQGHPRHFVAITEDITELKHASEELKRAKEAADAASRAKTAFLASMSHEIRTPMHAILGYSQLMLRDDSIGPQAKENLRIVNRSGEHLLALINDVLEMSKIESGRLKLDPAAFDLPSLLRDLAAMFRLRTSSKGIDLAVVQENALPRRVVADEGKVRQILINLLGNAVKFTHAGRITLRAAVQQEAPDRPLLTVEVEDTGIGIDAAETGKLFRPFEQTTSGRQAQSGTGLGLAISMEYARLMGGGISVSSEVGKGSTFRLEIPIEPGGADSIPPGVTAGIVTGLAPGQDSPKVLLADDDESHRGWLGNLLRSAGFDVRRCSNGGEAVALCGTWRPALVLMDIRMPQMDGYEATRQIKAAPGGDRIVVIALTANALDDGQPAAREAGVDDFLSKPLKELDLFQKIASHLGVRYRYAEASAASEPALGTGLAADCLSNLPPDLMVEMRQAILTGDMDRFTRALPEVAERSASVADGLRELADRYDYDALVELLR